MKKLIRIFLFSILLSIIACGSNSGGGVTGQSASYTVTYNGNGSAGGIVPVEGTSFSSGQTVTVQGNTGTLVYAGHSFTGWSTVADGSGTIYTQGAVFIIGSANVVLYAQWTTNPAFTVTYDINNGSGIAPVDSTTYENNDPVTVQSGAGLSKSGYTFTGWTVDSAGTGTVLNNPGTFNMGSSNVILYAKWTKNPTYKVTYDDNVSFFGSSTTGTVPDTAEYENGREVTVSANTGNLEKAGYAFIGWNTESDGSGTTYYAGNKFNIGSNDVTLYSIWSVKTHKITYVGTSSDSGDVPADATQYKEPYQSNAGQTVTVLGNIGVTGDGTDVLVRAGYTFTGWCVNADGTGTSYIAGNTLNMGTADITLYAMWTAVIPAYKVTYNSNGSTSGTVPDDSNNYLQDAVVTVSDNTGTLIKYGFTFAGWNTKADGTGTTYTYPVTFVMGNSDVTLYARWSADPTYTVTYNGNGSPNIDVPADSTNYLQGESVTVLPNTTLSLAGYSFTGWNTKADGSGTGYTQGNTFIIGSADVILYAQWISDAITTYTVAYDGNGNTGGSVPSDGTHYEASSTVTVMGNTQNLVKNGYVFAGWNTQADGNGASYTPDEMFSMGTANVILYAQWATAYKITYDGNGSTGGSVPVDSGNYSPGQNVTVLANSGSLVKTGSSFTGWNTAIDGTGTAYTGGNSLMMTASDVTLYAQWTTLAVYTVTYNGNGSDSGSVPVDSTSYLDGQTFNVLGNTGNLLKTGYYFIGWNTASNGSGIAYTQGQTGDIAASNVILYAQWTTNPTYTVTYNGNGSNGGTVSVDTTNYQAGDSVTVFDNTGNLSRSGYAFTGWNTSSSGTGTTYLPGSTFNIGTSNVVLYAKWEVAYTVKYNGNGNSGGSVPVDGVSYTSGQNATVLGAGTLVKSGYKFNGWTTSSDGSGTVYSQDADILIASSDITLYAKWTALVTYNVTYNANGATGGSVPLDSTNYLPGQTATVLANSGKLFYSLYSFAGWNTAANGSGTTYAPKATFTVTGNVTLYAKWVSSKAWVSITSSSDGSKLAAIINPGGVWVSSDSGAGWAQTYTSYNQGKWYGIASSSDGNKLVIANYTPSKSFGIGTFTTSWSWSNSGTTKGTFNSVASSGDGTKLAATLYNGQIYTSVNSGGTWTARDSVRVWRSITSSSDGVKLAAVVSNGQIYTSADSGATWTARASARNWYGIACSSDGTRLAAVVANGQIWTSNDSGATWTARASSKAWRSIASSSTGDKLVAVINGGQIYTSSDYGVTWVPRAASQAWYSVTSSSDGSRLAAAVYNGAIYTSSDSGVTWIAR